MKVAYKQALAEINIILENSDYEINSKIPEKFKKFIKENMDSNHTIELQAGKNLMQQEIMLETKQIIALIYRDYICSKEEKEKLILKEKKEIERLEKEKREKYAVKFDNIKLQEDIENVENTIERQLVVKEEKWYQKIISKVLSFFNKC